MPSYPSFLDFNIVSLPKSSIAEMRSDSVSIILYSVVGILFLLNICFSFSLSWQISTAYEPGYTSIFFSKYLSDSEGTFSKSIVTTSQLLISISRDILSSKLELMHFANFEAGGFVFGSATMNSILCLADI